MKILLSFALALLLYLPLAAQKDVASTKIEAIHSVVDAINRQDYAAMQKPWGVLGKVLLSKRRLRDEFAPFTDQYGLATLDTITNTSKYSYTAQLRMEKDPSRRVFLSFIFTESGKIMGFGIGYPTFAYKKTVPQATLSHNEMRLRIDSIVKKQHFRDSGEYFNGCVMATAGDSVIYKQCYGYSDFTTKSELNDSSMFLLASVSKQFTAFAIMLLQEQGKLNYSDKVTTYIPGFPFSDISIENLLTHTSGLPDYMQLLDKHWDKSKIATNADIEMLLAKHTPKPYFKPNEAFDYSNTGYIILSLTIEKASGMTYGAFLKENIFDVLEMNNTVVYARRVEEKPLENYAYGYVYDYATQTYILPDSSKNYNYVSYMDGITGDDGVSSSISDLAIWHKKVLQEGNLVSKENFLKARSPHVLNNGEKTQYGFGLMVQEGPSTENLLYHSGNWPGYYTMLMHFPHQNKSISILSNNYYAPFSSMADKIAALMLETKLE